MDYNLKNLPHRSVKPRNNGIVIVLDKGSSIRQVEDFIETCSAYTDIVKLGWGTSQVTPRLKEKIAVYHEAQIPVYFGGTLFEAYVLRDQLDDYLRLLDGYNIGHVEVSNGSIWLSEEKKRNIIAELSKNFTVLSEVGSKNPNAIIPPYKWVKMIKAELEAGAWKIICEARESGTVGVFRPNGEVRSGLVDEIVDQIPIDELIFEAPQKEQQVWFIKKFGANVNLGNILPGEIIPLETLRLGLRGDTLFDFFSLDDETSDLRLDTEENPPGEQH